MNSLQTGAMVVGVELLAVVFSFIIAVGLIYSVHFVVFKTKLFK